MEGEMVGLEEGWDVGSALLGFDEGTIVGVVVGKAVGTDVGAAVQTVKHTHRIILLPVSATNNLVSI